MKATFSYQNGTMSVRGQVHARYDNKEYSVHGALLLEEGIGKLLFLGKNESSLFFYYITIMSEFNVIRTEEEFREYFNEFLKKNGIEEVHDATIRRAISKLINLDIIVKLKRGRYRVNPFVAVKSQISLSQRESIMRRYLVESGKVEPDFEHDEQASRVD